MLEQVGDILELPLSYAAITVMFARLARSFPPPRLARGFSAATPSFVEVNGQKFHVLSAGDATAPPLLCMPGAMGTAETDWAPQLEGLAAGGRRVISFDPRGYGQSRPPARRFPHDYYHIDAADAAGLMRALGHERYDLMGWSDGANAGVILAAQNAAAVRKLVVFGGNSYITQEDIDAYEATRDVAATWSKRMKASLEPIYGDDLQPMWSSFCDGMQAIFAEGGDICQAEARALACPTFVLGGEKDPIVPANHPRWFAENIPGARLHMFPEGKHNIHLRFADEFNQLVLDFLKED